MDAGVPARLYFCIVFVFEAVLQGEYSKVACFELRAICPLFLSREILFRKWVEEKKV